LKIILNPELLLEENRGKFKSPKDTRYPKDVEIYAASFVVGIDAHIEKEISRDWIFEEFCKIATERWISEGELYYKTDEIELAIFTAALNTSTDEMVRDGILDVIENENGEEIIFITEKGKLVAKEWGIEEDPI
jgi:hypothetical protein